MPKGGWGFVTAALAVALLGGGTLAVRLAARRRCWLPWVLGAIAVATVVVPALALFLDGVRNPRWFVGFAGLPGLVVGYAVFAALRGRRGPSARAVRRRSTGGPVQTDRSHWIAVGLLGLAVMVLLGHARLASWWAGFQDRGAAETVTERPAPAPGEAAPPAVPQGDAVPVTGWRIAAVAPPESRSLSLSAWLARPWRLAQGERHRPLALHHPRCWLETGPGEGPVFYTDIRLGETDHCVAVTGWGGADPHFWIDVDGDGRFGDADRRYRNQGNGRLAAMIRLPMPDRWLRNADPRNHDYALWLWVRETAGGRLQLRYYPTTELVTRAPLPGGGVVLAVVAERRGGRDGDFRDDGVYLDLDGDGRLQPDEYVPPGGALQSPDGRWWRPRVRLP